MNTVRRVSYVFLCIVPFLNFVVVGVRAFRVPGVYQAVGVAYFAAIAIAAWTLSAGAIRADVQGRRLLGLAGIRNPRRTVRCEDCAGGQLAGQPLDAVREQIPTVTLPQPAATAGAADSLS